MTITTQPDLTATLSALNAHEVAVLEYACRYQLMHGRSVIDGARLSALDVPLLEEFVDKLFACWCDIKT